MEGKSEVHESVRIFASQLQELRSVSDTKLLRYKDCGSGNEVYSPPRSAAQSRLNKTLPSCRTAVPESPTASTPGLQVSMKRMFPIRH
jgi:hypothetical protein